LITHSTRTKRAKTKGWLDAIYLGGAAVGVIVVNDGRYLASIAERIWEILAPDARICIAPRATSMQTVQVIPCGSHCGRPLASRPEMKQSSLF
jgi:hypothetical protein